MLCCILPLLSLRRVYMLQVILTNSLRKAIWRILWVFCQWNLIRSSKMFISCTQVEFYRICLFFHEQWMLGMFLSKWPYFPWSTNIFLQVGGGALQAQYTPTPISIPLLLGYWINISSIKYIVVLNLFRRLVCPPASGTNCQDTKFQ